MYCLGLLQCTFCVDVRIRSLYLLHHPQWTAAVHICICVWCMTWQSWRYLSLPDAKVMFVFASRCKHYMHGVLTDLPDGRPSGWKKGWSTQCAKMRRQCNKNSVPSLPGMLAAQMQRLLGKGSIHRLCWHDEMMAMGSGAKRYLVTAATLPDVLVWWCLW